MEITVEGRSVFAATGGRVFDPGRPAVLFLHGAGMDHSVWTMQTRYLSHHGRAVLAVDLPGHGRSAGSPLPSIEAMAAWVTSLLDACGLDKAVLVGHSMGGLIALEAAARSPERVSRLALLGSIAEMPVNPALLAATREDQEKAIGMIVTWGVGRPSHVGGYRVPGLWVMGSVHRLLQRAGEGVLFTDFNACNAYRGGAAAAAAVTCPALVVAGDGDVMTPPKAAGALASAIADARLAVIPGAGHLMMIEKPDETLDVLSRFL